MNLLQETAKNETDCRIKFRRVSDNSVYCVMAPATVDKLRRANQLDSFLQKQLESGVVIRTFKD